MKKARVKLLMLSLLICTLLITPFLSFTAYAMPLSNDESDIVFLENLNELLEYSGASEAEVLANKEYIYDINLDILGYLYDFSVDGIEGFGIVVNAGNDYELAEFYFDAISPYLEIEGEQRVYISSMNYAYYSNEQFYWAETHEEISEKILNQLMDVAVYSGGGSAFWITSETIYYTYRSETKQSLAMRHPSLYDIVSVSNGCVPVAGANLIQYHDRFKENLIPDYVPGNYLQDFYLYKGNSTFHNELKWQLASDMSTNNPNPGTTIAQFKTGMTTFCNRQGYSISFLSCMSGSSFSYSSAKQRLESGLPLMLFVDKYTVTDIYTKEGYDLLDVYNDKYTHGMAAFGYKEVTYTLTNGATRKDSYLAVATGIGERITGFFNVNYNTTIDDCYGVSIN